ncbi:MAG: C-GCAxxG-C-C family protein [Negativicutes bacterium]|nr:C-GCAxxG-C-C family protein [Negativicutes bacterium]
MEALAGVKELAGQRFKEGYNCAEAILRAFVEKLGLEVSDDALKMASGFGGGVGHAGCMCGALTAATMVLGLLEGRTSKEQSRGAIYESAGEFHKLFTEKFGTSCCRVLNPHPFETKEHLRNCLKITGNTAELLEKYLGQRMVK